MKAADLWLGAAVLRAVESYRPHGERLFDDSVSMALLPPFWRGVIRLLKAAALLEPLLALRERQFPGVIGNLLCRTRYIDDVLEHALGSGLDQVVVLGAGFDTRAYRMGRAEQARFFEVDHPVTQARKQARLERLFGKVPRNVTLVPVDFERQKLEQAMAAAGLAVGSRTFFIWEGVTQYISVQAVDDTLGYVADAGGPQITIAFTYIRKGIIDGSSRSPVDEKVLRLTRRFGVPWIFGLEPTEVGGYLAARGLSLVEDVGAAEYQERYLEPLGRDMRVYEGERMVLAKAGLES
jgi:methyltransferase (TIGR00027 family)